MSVWGISSSILFFGLGAVGGLYYLLTGVLTEPALFLGLQIGLHATVLIAINNLRDREGDARVGKRTLAVRLGVALSRVEIAALVFFPFLMNAYWWGAGLRWASLLPLLSLPLAIAVVRGVAKNPPGVVYNKYLGMAAGLHLLFGLLLSLGLVCA